MLIDVKMFVTLNKCRKKVLFFPPSDQQGSFFLFFITPNFVRLK